MEQYEAVDSFTRGSAEVIGLHNRCPTRMEQTLLSLISSVAIWVWLHTCLCFPIYYQTVDSENTVGNLDLNKKLANMALNMKQCDRLSYGSGT